MSPSSRESNGIEVQAEGAGPQLFSAEDYRAWIEAEMRTAVKAVLEEILEAELSAHLGAARSERTASRRGYRNGSYGRRALSPNSWDTQREAVRVCSRRNSAGDFIPSAECGATSL